MTAPTPIRRRLPRATDIDAAADADRAYARIGRSWQLPIVERVDTEPDEAPPLRTEEEEQVRSGKLLLIGGLIIVLACVVGALLVK